LAERRPHVEEEAGYQSVLVTFENGHYASSVVRTAVRLAARRRHGIHVLVTITVPTTSAIDAAMPDEEASAQAIIDSARVLGGRRVTGRWEKVRPGQAGRRIVDAARAMDARAIVAPRPPARRGASLFGRTLETVLEERPCRVIIESAPAEAGGGSP
jgi:APA family basic amino acid/polyamine antiporter